MWMMWCFENRRPDTWDLFVPVQNPRAAPNAPQNQVNEDAVDEAGEWLLLCVVQGSSDATFD